MESDRSWPLRPDGTPEPPALLERDGDFPALSGITLSLLESCGIPARTDLSSTGLVNRVYGGFALDGVPIWVPESRLEEARAILLALPENEDQNTGGTPDKEEMT